MKLVCEFTNHLSHAFKKYKINTLPANILYHIPSSFISILREPTDVQLQKPEKQNTVLLAFVLTAKRN